MGRNTSWFPPSLPIQNLRPSYALQPLPPMQNLRPSTSSLQPLPPMQNLGLPPSLQPCPPPPVPNLNNIPVPIAASIFNFVGKKVMIKLLDDRKLIGTIRSFEHCNIVLDGAVERISDGVHYSDIPIGLSVIRGENLVFIEEMDSQIAVLPPMQNLRPPPPSFQPLQNLRPPPPSFQPLLPLQNLRPPPPSFQPLLPLQNLRPPLPIQPLLPLPIQPIKTPAPIAASMAPFLDKKVILMLLDDRKLIGTVRSFDEHGNIVLEGTVDRKVVGDLYCDDLIGLCLIRGENLVLIGEMDSQTPELPPQMTLVSPEDIQRAEKAEKESLHIKSTMRKRMAFLDSD